MRVALLCLLLAACQVRNPHYCPPGQTCLSGDGSMRCDDNTDCGDTGVCDLSQNQCVACLMNSDCSLAAPVCANKMCTKCTKHDDCPSKACTAEGACLVAEDVAYVVSPTGSDNATCSQAVPCRNIMHAINTGRPNVKVTGMFDEAVVIDSKNTRILAEKTAKLTRSGGGGAIVDIRNASNVSIHDLTIGSATGGGVQSIGISMSTGTPTVGLFGVTITGNDGRGIAVTGGSITIERSTISQNINGGIEITNATKAVIVNNFIVNNGRGTGTGQSNVGGVNIANLTDMNGSRFGFNTVVQNENSGGSALAAGVACQVSGVDAGGNIVYSNTRGTTTSDGTQTVGGCVFGNTFAMGMVAGDLGFNLTSDPPVYRLVAGSPMTVRDVGGTCPMEDFDRQARPFNNACDLGADEFVMP